MKVDFPLAPTPVRIGKMRCSRGRSAPAITDNTLQVVAYRLVRQHLGEKPLPWPRLVVLASSSSGGSMYAAFGHLGKHVAGVVPSRRERPLSRGDVLTVRASAGWRSVLRDPT